MANHRWSGWPGAWCLDCGQEDGMEIAVARGDYDPYSEQWASPILASLYRKVYPPECPCPGEERFDPYKKLRDRKETAE